MTEKRAFPYELDVYRANYDHPGPQQMIENHQEKVLYHQNSMMRIWYNNVTTSYPIHWHPSIEIIVPITNHYDVHAQNTDYHVVPGDIIIIPPGTPHSCTAPDTGERFVYIFDITQMTELAGFAGIQPLLAQPIYITKDSHPPIYDDIMHILTQIRNEYFMETEYYELTIFSLLLNLFTRLGYHHINSQTLFQSDRSNVQKFNNLLRYIDNHLTENLSLQETANNIGFSKYHFSRLFRQYTGFTFCDYVNYRRIKKAETLLAQMELSITEVAMSAGFPSISTFNRLFKQYKNCTPSEFRAQNS